MAKLIDTTPALASFIYFIVVQNSRVLRFTVGFVRLCVEWRRQERAGPAFEVKSRVSGVPWALALENTGSLRS